MVHPHPGYFVSGIVELEINTYSAIAGSVTYFSLARSSSPPIEGEGIERKDIVSASGADRAPIPRNIGNISIVKIQSPYPRRRRYGLPL